MNIIKCKRGDLIFFLLWMHLSHFLSKYRAIFEKRLWKKGLNGSMIFSTMTLTMDNILRLFIVHKKCKNSAKTEIKMYSRFLEGMHLMWRVLITLTSLTSMLLLQRSSIILFKRQICLVSVTFWKPIWYFSHDGSTWLFYKERKCGLFRVKFIHIFKAQSKGLQSFFTCLTWTFWHWLRNSIVLIWKFRRKVHKYFSRVEKILWWECAAFKNFFEKVRKSINHLRHIFNLIQFDWFFVGFAKMNQFQKMYFVSKWRLWPIEYFSNMQSHFLTKWNNGCHLSGQKWQSILWWLSWENLVNEQTQHHVAILTCEMVSISADFGEGETLRFYLLLKSNQRILIGN